MRSLLTVIGGVLALAGAIWFFQGIGILPGSFMTGQTRWAVYGAVAIGVGLALVSFARRRPVPDHGVKGTKGRS